MIAVGDGALGFWAALRDVWPETVEQRDWVHKVANVLDALPKSVQPTAKKMLDEIRNAEDRDHAVAAAKRFDSEFRTKWPKAADKITQSLHYVDKQAKPALLRDILSKDLDALTLVFARTKHGAEKLMKGLVADGFNAASIHGNKSQGQRDRAIKAFRAGTTTILVATDVAARGIDIPGVSFVINYDLPEVPENYVHRIGRTARAGREGEAIAFCAPEEAKLLRQIQKVMKIDIPVASGVAPTAQEQAKEPKSPPRYRRKGKPGGANAHPRKANPGGANAQTRKNGPRRRKRQKQRAA